VRRFTGESKVNTTAEAKDKSNEFLGRLLELLTSVKKCFKCYTENSECCFTTYTPEGFGIFKRPSLGFYFGSQMM
jgi:hypothetical protein